MARSASRLANVAAVHLSALGSVAFLAVTPASAEEGFSLDVKANVANVCNIGFANGASGALDFGPVTPGDPAATPSVTLKIFCTFANMSTVTIDNGKNDSSGRHLRLGPTGPMVPYLLCLNQAEEGCGEFPSAGQDFSVGAGENNGSTFIIAGYINAINSNNFTEEGLYEDTLTVELSF